MPRPVYTTLAQIAAKLPADFILQALDDDKDGIIDPAVWQAVAEDAADQVDDRLGQRYPVPFDPENLSAKVRAASLMFVLETLHIRRGLGTEETNPFLNSARAARKELSAIGSGEVPLSPEAKRPHKSVATVTEPARTSSASGHLSS
jgi:phage gp36-like protein